MKIEELKDEDKKAESILRYWFPLPKGYSRLLVVCCVIIIIIIVCTQNNDGDRWGVLFLTPLVEFIIYILVMWIYHGFKETNKN